MRKAVLVIDVQSVLFNSEPPPFQHEAVVAQINRITAWARPLGYPVIFIQHESEGTAIAHGSKGWQLLNTLQTENVDLYVRKETSDSFLNTKLKKELQRFDVSALIVCGYATEFCVDTTIRSAAAQGYPVTLVADAHTTHDKSHLSAEQIRQHHNQSLAELTSFDAPIYALPTERLVS